MPREPRGLDGFQALTAPAQLELLHGVCSSTAWARDVLAGAPFRDATAMLDRADRALATLSEAELDAALDGHPRIGARVDNPSSAREQAAVAAAADDVRTALAVKNREYDEKFGYVYLVCASGRSAGELLSDVTARLDNDPDTERQVMRGELAKINRLRLERLLNKPSGAGSTP